MTGSTVAIDIGTCWAAAAVAEDARSEAAEVGTAFRIPSVVCRGADGVLVTGTAALERAVVAPELTEWMPKRALVNSGTMVRLGATDVSVIDLVTAVLGQAAREAGWKAGAQGPAAVVLTHPARWGDSERALLAEAARRAGLPGQPRLVPEPVAAAAFYVERSMPVGAYVAVFDWGGATLGATVLRRTRGGFAMVGPPGGVSELGGDDLDAALLELVGEHARAVDADAWNRLMTDGDRQTVRDRVSLLRAVTDLKETLSEQTAGTMLPSGFPGGIRVTRPELEERIGPLVRRAVEELRVTVERAGLRPADLAAVYLAGGSSRVPLVATLVAAELGVVPTVAADPRSVVALGALQIALGRVGLAPLVAGSSPAAPSSAVTRVAVTWLSSYQAGRGPDALPLPDGTSQQSGGSAGPGTVRPAGWRPWRTVLRGDPTVLAYADDTLYAAGGVVTAVDPANGAVRWVSPPVPRLARLDAAGGAVYGHDGDRLLAFDAATGGPRWAYQVRGTPIVAGGLVLVGTRGELLALDAVSGQRRWRYAPGAELRGLAVPGDGRAYLATADRRVRAVAIGTGDETWRLDLPQSGGPATAPAVSAGVLFMATSDGPWAVDADTGELLWRAPAPAGDERTMDGSGRRLVLVTPDLLYLVGRGVAAFAMADGAARWRTADGQGLVAVPSVGGGVLCGRVATGYVAFDARAGRPRWGYPGGGVNGEPVLSQGCAFLACAPPAGSGGSAAGLGRWMLVAVDLVTGQPRWRVWLPGALVAGPVVVGDVLHLLLRRQVGPAAESAVYAVDTRNGAVIRAMAGG